MEYGANHIKPSDMWKDIKPRIGEMLVAVNDIETRYGKAVDEAYQSGYEDGKGDSSGESRYEAYQKGLGDAWEAAWKIIDMPWETKREIFGSDIFAAKQIFKGRTASDAASDAIIKLKLYEQEHEDPIHEGDEVVGDDGKRGLVIDSRFDKSQIAVLTGDSKVYAWWCKDYVKKTGRSCPELVAFLKKMKENEE